MKRAALASLLMFLLSSCQNDTITQPQECPHDTYLKLSELETKSDHNQPFILYNDIQSKVVRAQLNNRVIPFSFDQCTQIDSTGFYELIIEKNSAQPDTFLFTVNDNAQSLTEWGIPSWSPVPITPEILNVDKVEVYYPRRFVPGMEIPFIFSLSSGGEQVEGYSIGKAYGKEFCLKHGVGSMSVSADILGANPLFDINAQTVSPQISIYNSEQKILGGRLSEDLTIEKNTVVRITSDLTIPEQYSLTIAEGAIVLVDEAVNIVNSGPVTINGSRENPILITCTDQSKYWGGFISKNSSSIIDASCAIFSRSGYHDTEDYRWGHAKRQALFYLEATELHMRHCFMIDHIGQIFYPQSSVLTLDSILVQRVKTAGQLNFSQATITNCIFTDFPDDHPGYRDDDNDGLYIHGSDVVIDNCIFMFTKDDGIDSGGDRGGTVVVRNSRFENCAHEGAALSSKGDVVKKHVFENCVFSNNSQGLELGYSGPNHEVHADQCIFIHNGVGIRYGDNYTDGVDGYMYVSNSRSINNSRNVWNMVRRIWSPRLENMQFENVQVSRKCSQYPDLQVLSTD